MAEDKVPTGVEVIIGTYEEFLIGFKLQQTPEMKYSFVPSFTNHAHSGSVRCLASSTKFLTSGSTDETIRIFNMMTRLDVGTLLHHQGTINSVEFWKDSHLFSGSDDGNICIWNAKQWTLLKTLKGHKGSITDVSVHPSGKMLLSISKDKTLRTWNLIKGRCGYVTNIKFAADIVKWTPSGKMFVVAFPKKLDVYDITVGGVVYTIEFKNRVNCLEFISPSIVAIGSDTLIEFHDIVNKKKLHSLKAHESRVKSIVCLTHESFSGINETDVWLFTISNDGYLKLWKIPKETVDKIELLSSVDSTCRCICFSLSLHENVNSEKLAKRKGKKQRPNEMATKKQKP